MNCSKCACENKAGARFCKACGESLHHADKTGAVDAPSTSCDACSAPLATTARFCNKCGTPVAARTTQAEGRHEPPPVHAASIAADAPLPPRLSHCPQCDAAYSGSPKFCKSCGANFVLKSTVQTELATSPIPADPAPMPAQQPPGKETPRVDDEGMPPDDPLAPPIHIIAPDPVPPAAASERGDEPDAPAPVSRGTNKSGLVAAGLAVFGVVAVAAAVLLWPQQDAPQADGAASAPAAAASSPATAANSAPPPATARLPAQPAPESKSEAPAQPGAAAPVEPPAPAAASAAPERAPEPVERSIAPTPMPKAGKATPSAMDQSARTPPAPQDGMAAKIAALAAKADGHLQNKQYDKAIATAETILELAPGNRTATELIAKAKEKQLEVLRNGSSIE